jgi:hypothetical protein
MHIEEKTDLIRSMVRLQDGQTLPTNYITYFILLLKSIQIHKGNQGIERTLKFMSRCEATLDLEEI